MQNGICTETFFNGIKGVGLKPAELLLFILVMESVNDLIGKPDKAVNCIYGPANGFSQQAYSQ